MMEPAVSIEGRCHCGNISYQVRLKNAQNGIPVRACSCSFCLMHGGVYTSDPDGDLAVHIQDRSLVNDYRFGTESADFLICRQCGVVPVVTSEIDGILYAVVNANTFLDIEPSSLHREVTNFDGESTADRLHRRVKRWIPGVRIER